MKKFSVSLEDKNLELINRFCEERCINKSSMTTWLWLQWINKQEQSHEI